MLALLAERGMLRLRHSAAAVTRLPGGNVVVYFYAVFGSGRKLLLRPRAEGPPLQNFLCYGFSVAGVGAVGLPRRLVFQAVRCAALYR